MIKISKEKIRYFVQFELENKINNDNVSIY